MRILSFSFAFGLITVSAIILTPQDEAKPITEKAGLSSQFKSYIAFEKLSSPPKQWKYQEPAPSGTKINLRIGLKLQNIERFHQMVVDLSTPGHPTYGQHMTQDEINAIINPLEKSAQLVLEWLKASGIHAVHDNQWVEADVTIAQAQELLQTRFGVYRNAGSRKSAIRTLSYHLPDILQDHIDLVHPTTMFGFEPLGPHSRMDRSKYSKEPNENEKEPAPRDCEDGITPRCLMELYKIKDVDLHDKNHPTIGIPGFLGEYGNRDDLQTFLERYQPDFVGRNYTTILVNGGLDDQSKPGGEANLDIQYIAGLTIPDAVTYYSVGGSPPFIPDLLTPNNTNEPYEEFLEHLLNPNQTTKIPEVISISYSDKEQTVPKSYAERICNLFAQLGARGTTVLVASGDDGVAVGATIGMSPERGVLFSGGGFSEYFQQPAWQRDKVQSYLATTPEAYKDLYNPEGRAYPDVAAQGVGFQNIVKGMLSYDSGTSASAPVFASVVWHINNARAIRGLQPLGFLNPILYSNPQALNDVLSGNNPGCGTHGFNATVGWDPVTGLGTPDLSKLTAAFA
ncbi:hypothetical protein BGZ68_002443 [Mortierella alpina]|nr:hypothetical protein BGZ68_002443 [Mortierella alpina]